MTEVEELEKRLKKLEAEVGKLRNTGFIINESYLKKYLQALIVGELKKERHHSV